MLFLIFFIFANQNVLRPEDDIKLIDSDKEEGKRGSSTI